MINCSVMVDKDLLKQYLEKTIEREFGGSVSATSFTVETTDNLSHGDFYSNIPFVIGKITKQEPSLIANRLIKALQQDNSPFSVEFAGKGFLNFTYKDASLFEVIKKEENILFSENKNGLMRGKRVIVEFAHPNTHKEFHIGHLRNICLGESLVRIFESQGAEVIRVNYQGDVGLHVAKALWGLRELLKERGLSIDDVAEKDLSLRIKLLAEAYALGHKAFENPDLTEQVVEVNRMIYRKESGIYPLWEKTREWSLRYFDTIYLRLGSRFDRFFFESEVFEEGLRISKMAKGGGILKESEGAVVFDGGEYGLDTRVFITKEGLPTYEAKELGLAFKEFSEFGRVAKCIHVVAPEQSSFFKVTFKVEELIDRKMFEGKQEHFAYGYVDLKSGKMSSRSGNVVSAVDLIESAKGKARLLIKEQGFSEEEVDNISEVVAVGAVKYTMLKYGAKKNIYFDLDESVALVGNCAPYLQYVYSRTQAIIRKSVDAGSTGDTLDLVVEMVAEEKTLLHTLVKFKDVVERAALHYSPNIIAEYLYDLAQRYNHFYNSIPILKAEGLGIQAQRVLLTKITGKIIKEGLRLLGINVLERM